MGNRQQGSICASGNKKGRGIGQGGAMLCATLALIIFGSVFGLHVMDATIDHSGESSLHQGSDWK